MKRLFLLLPTLCCAGMAAAQYPALRTLELRGDGVKHPVEVIAEDATGLLWVGGPSGVVRTDGVRHQVMLVSEPVAVTALAADGVHMWVGLANGLLLRCSGLRTDTVADLGREEGVAITALVMDDQRRLWAGTRAHGVRVVEGTQVRVVDIDQGLPDDHVNALCALKGYGVVAATDQGVVLFGPDLGPGLKLDASNGLPDNLVLSLCAEGEGTIWAGTHAAGPVRISFRDNGISALDPGWTHGPVTAVTWGDGMVWAGTEHDGMVVCGTRKGMGRYVRGEEQRVPMVACTVTAQDGAVWWGDGSDVLVRAEPSSLIIPDHEAVDLRAVNAVAGDAQGRIWVVTPEGVFGHASEFSEGERMNALKLPELGVPITSIHAADDGVLWLGTLGAGLLRVIPAAMPQPLSIDPGSAGDNVMAMRDQGEVLWIGTLDGLASLRNDLSGGIKRHPLPGSGFVYDVLPMPDGSVLAATDGHGVMRLAPDGNVVPLSTAGKRTFYSLCLDATGRAWACGPGTGLCEVVGGELVPRTPVVPPFDDEVFGLAPSGDRLVLLTATGAHVFDPSTGHTRHLDGVLPGTRMEGVLNADHAAADGTVWFATAFGLVRWRSDTASFDTAVPTLITGLLVAGEEVPVQDQLRVDHTRNALRIQFTGLHYAAPERVRFEYQLVGSDPTVRTGRDREVAYGRLAPGHYTFQVRAFVEGDTPNGPWTSLRIHITPPWWRTPWAVAGLVLILIASSYLLLRARDRRIRAREEMERERVRFQLEALRSQVNPHFLFNSFGTLLELIEEDKSRAALHVERLSAFFREILQVRDREVIPVEEELRLLDIYFALEQERFGKRIGLYIRIDEDARRAQLPPLTLQLLVENALKHNAASDEAPLHIEVLSANGDLLVRNPIRPRQTRPASSGFGLESILRRYQALTDRPVGVRQENGVFEVRVPLITGNP